MQDTLIFAFVQGFIEHLRGYGGRTHPTNQEWNESYDKGMNLADIVTLRN